MTSEEIYISVDIETDGPIPAENSMLSFGAAAFLLSSEEPVSTFERNLELLEGAKPDGETMKWWATQPAAWAACREGPLHHPKDAMHDFVRWVRVLQGLYGPPVFVGYPTGFDFTYMYWYLVKFTGVSPFSFSCLDIKTLAMAVLGTNFRSTTKRNMPKEWFEGTQKHSHKALEDAIGQGQLFIRIMRELEELRRIAAMMAG